jgi:hypothetical protein
MCGLSSQEQFMVPTGFSRTSTRHLAYKTARRKEEETRSKTRFLSKESLKKLPSSPPLILV